MLEQIKRVLEGAVDAAVILDQEHRVLYRNSAYDAYTGKRPREVACRRGGGRHALPPALQPRYLLPENCIFMRARRGRRESRCACTSIHAKRGDGEHADPHCEAMPLGSAAVLETYRDVTAESGSAQPHALSAPSAGQGI